MTGSALFEKMMRRLAALKESSGLSFIESLNTAVEVIFLRLWAKRSDIVRKPLAVVPTTETFYMPADFRGFAEDPYLVYADGKKFKLVPLVTGGEQELEDSTDPTPKYYRLTGNEVQLFPYTYVPGLNSMSQDEIFALTEAEINALPQEGDIGRTLKGQYFAHPGELEMADTLPWNGVLDMLIEDAVLAAARFGGLSSMLANQEFLVTMDAALDGVLTSRRNPAPRRVRAHYF